VWIVVPGETTIAELWLGESQHVPHEDAWCKRPLIAKVERAVLICCAEDDVVDWARTVVPEGHLEQRPFAGDQQRTRHDGDRVICDVRRWRHRVRVRDWRRDREHRGVLPEVRIDPRRPPAHVARTNAQFSGSSVPSKSVSAMFVLVILKDGAARTAAAATLPRTPSQFVRVVPTSKRTPFSICVEGEQVPTSVKSSGWSS
jgi:hypothetical protein